MYWIYVLGLRFFFFKQKTAYDMRISDWSSDVCSSDLPDLILLPGQRRQDVAHRIDEELRLERFAVRRIDVEAFHRLERRRKTEARLAVAAEILPGAGTRLLADIGLGPRQTREQRQRLGDLDVRLRR